MSLPQKSFLTLQQVIERWKHWGCDVETLLDYAHKDNLTFALYLRNIGSHRSINDGSTTEITSWRFISPDHIDRSIYYITANDARRILEAKPNEQIAIRALYWNRSRINKEATYCATAKYVTRDDLIVTSEECERFERRHSATGFNNLFARLKFSLAKSNITSIAAKIAAGLAAIIAGAWAVFTWWHS